MARTAAEAKKEFRENNLSVSISRDVAKEFKLVCLINNIKPKQQLQKILAAWLVEAKKSITALPVNKKKRG